MTFFVFTLYNVPIVVTGFYRLLTSRRQKTKQIEDSEKELPSISIVVPVKNEEKVVARLLDALLRLNYPSGKREIIVVNDASTDRTREIMSSVLFG